MKDDPAPDAMQLDIPKGAEIKSTVVSGAKETEDI